jgi:hypothetical protein
MTQFRLFLSLPLFLSFHLFRMIIDKNRMDEKEQKERMKRMARCGFTGAYKPLAGLCYRVPKARNQQQEPNTHSYLKVIIGVFARIIPAKKEMIQNQVAYHKRRIRVFARTRPQGDY